MWYSTAPGLWRSAGRTRSLPGVFWIDYTSDGGEYPKFWEPGTRIRYRLVADRLAVARFPATYSIEGKRLLFHTSDGQTPRPGELLMSAHDCGLFVNRPHVTVRGISFQNYLAREKWSTGIDLRVNHITVEDCRSSNCSMGFIITGNDNAVRRCTAEDVGGGVYVGGENATVEDCRLFKRRDAFMVPMYAQDDTGIQYYSPACGGLIRGNLCEGFGMGVFIKAGIAPYVVEHNTLVGLGQGLGFGSTSWHPDQRFRYNIIADCDRQVEVYVEKKEGESRDIDYNCYWSASRGDLQPVGANDLVADPKFVWPQWQDYRLANDSPCLNRRMPPDRSARFRRSATRRSTSARRASGTSAKRARRTRRLGRAAGAHDSVRRRSRQARRHDHRSSRPVCGTGAHYARWHAGSPHRHPRGGEVAGRAGFRSSRRGDDRHLPRAVCRDSRP